MIGLLQVTTKVNDVTDLFINLGEILGGIVSLVALYFRMQNKLDLQKNDFQNFKDITRENLNKLENNMKDSYSKIENKMSELEEKMEVRHRELSEKIDKVPETIATIFRSFK